MDINTFYFSLLYILLRTHKNYSARHLKPGLLAIFLTLNDFYNKGTT